MLIGQYRIKIGAKHRVALPKKFRDELGEKVIITRGYEGCLVIVDQKRWEKITKDVVQGSFVDRRIRDSGRFLLADAHEIELDEQGRFVLPASLIEYACLETDAVFIGLVNWVEVWSREKWNEQEDYIERNSESVAQEIADLVRQGS